MAAKIVSGVNAGRLQHAATAAVPSMSNRVALVSSQAVSDVVPVANSPSAQLKPQGLGWCGPQSGSHENSRGPGSSVVAASAAVAAWQGRRKKLRAPRCAAGVAEQVVTNQNSHADAQEASAPSRSARAKRRPPRRTMSQRTPLAELPSLDYLETCLVSGLLEEADQVTRDLVLAFSGPNALARGFALPAEVQNIPSVELRAIDHVWLKHTNGKFGYSVQSRIWRDVDCDWSSFLPSLGWLVRDSDGHGEMLRYWPRRQFDYSLTAPSGHLPLTNMIRGRDLLRALLEHPAWTEDSSVGSVHAGGGATDSSQADVGSNGEAALESAVQRWWAEITGAGDEDGEPDEKPTASALGDSSVLDGAAPQPFGEVTEAVVSFTDVKAPRSSEAVNPLDGLQKMFQEWFGGSDSARTTETQTRAPKNSLSASANAQAGLEFDFRGPGEPIFRITLVTGFETFNVRLYAEAARSAIRGCQGLQVCLFTDKDLETRPELVADALAETDVFFSSLVFDFDQSEWLQERIKGVPVRFVFESALELMSCTCVGDFTMAGAAGSKGAPPAVRSMLSMLTGTREEDRVAGYTKFLKSGPKLLKFLPPVGPLPDLRRWLQTYAYWSGGGAGNVAKMLLYISREFGALNVNFDNVLTAGEAAGSDGDPGVVEIPQVGLLHPSKKYAFGPGPFFETPKEYLEWYRTYRPEAFEENWPVCAVLLFRKHVISELPYIPQLINFFEEQHKLLPLPIFIQGVDAHIAVRDLLTSTDELAAVAAGRQPANPTLSDGAIKVDCVVNTIGFPLVGGPAGSMEGGRNAEIAKEILSSLNVPYVAAAPLLIQDVASWKEQGIGGLQGIVLYALPELDGAVDAVPLGGLLKNSGEIELLPDRADRLAVRLRRWVQLRRKARHERKVAVVLYGYPPGLGAAGTAALLNVPNSLHRLLVAMREEGYDVGDLPDDPEVLLRGVVESDAAAESGQAYGNASECRKGAVSVSADALCEWLPRESQQAVEGMWGEGLLKSGIRTIGDEFLLGGRVYGNVWIGVQPPLGIPGDPMRLLFDRDMTPHPQYVAFYKYLENDFGADAVIHFGMHGTAEWLPGKSLGNMSTCWPDQLLGSLPNVYLYAANNPSESVLAKRRGYATIVSYNVPPYSRAGLYKELQSLRGLLAETMEQSAKEEDVVAAAKSAGASGVAAVAAVATVPGDRDGACAITLEGTILQSVLASGLDKDVPLPSVAADAIRSFKDEDDEIRAEAAAKAIGRDEFIEYTSRLRAYLGELEKTLFSSGLHTLSRAPDEAGVRAYLEAYFDGDGRPALPQSALDSLSRGAPVTEALHGCSAADITQVEEAGGIRDLLMRNTEELDGMLRALNGEYILPAPGGDLLRDGAGVLPTGRNIHALDPYRIPSKAALARGIAAAEATVQQHLKDFGTYPETIAVNLWGLEAIKTKGESVAVVLGLIGARPAFEATGRVARYELIPLEELGRPRVDAFCSLSGIFRDTFSNIVDLLDDALRRAAEAEDESVEQNFVRKHFLELQDTEGVDGAATRIFSNAAGEFGSLVNERVSAGSWEETAELGETWAQRNAFAFGRGQRGVERRGVLDALLSTSGSMVQLLDSVEYGLTDIQEYYANTGAMVRKMSDLQGRKVDALVVETTQKEVRPRKLDNVLRREYRTKLLNPKWATAMVAEGSGGAFEVSQRMTALVGWGATSQFQESWVYDQGVEQYVLDKDMAEKLRASNPEAFRNIVGRFLEANARGMWDASSELIDELQELYRDLGDELEGF